MITYLPSILTAINWICAIVLLATVIARVNDIGRHQFSPIWVARRIGLLLVGAWCFMFILGMAHPQMEQTLVVGGMTLCWLTTPNMPPWWNWITGRFHHEPQYGRRRDDA